MVVLVGLVFLGCGDDPVSPVDARAELESRGISYTAAAFLDSAYAGNLAVVKLFVQAGMPVDVTNDVGWTALHFAAYGGSLSVVEYLVGRGLDVNATNNDGQTPRDWAVRYSQTDVAAYLESVGG